MVHFFSKLYEMLNQHSTPFDFSSCPVRTMKAEPEFALSRRSGSAFALVPAVRMPLAIARSGERTELPSKIFNLLLPQVPENVFILSMTDRLFLGTSVSISQAHLDGKE